jgi:hypothetical protein
MGKPGQRLYRVVRKSLIMDVTAICGRSISTDLLNRDFTINALAADTASGEIIDVAGGRADLSAGLIRMVSRSCFTKDPIRLVRAFRMAAVLRFEVLPETVSAVRKQAELIKESAGERVRTELMKILETRHSARVVAQMASCGLLAALFPELGLSGDFFGHTRNMLSELENLLVAPQRIIPADIDPLVWSPERMPVALLKFALVLHDLAQPATDLKGCRRFQRRHPAAGAASDITARMKFSNREAHYLDVVGRNQRWPALLFEAHQRRRLSERAVTRFFITCGDMTPDIVLHAAASGSRAKGGDGPQFSAFARRLLKRYFTVFLPRSSVPPLLTGKDLIGFLGLEPAPVFGTLLRRIEAERLAGRLQSKEAALSRVKKLLQRRPARCWSKPLRHHW